MSLQDDIIEIKKITEAGLFKPATPEQIASRPTPESSVCASCHADVSVVDTEHCGKCGCDLCQDCYYICQNCDGVFCADDMYYEKNGELYDVCKDCQAIYLGEAGLFKPRSPEQVRVGQADLYGDLKKNSEKKVLKLKNIVFPKIIAALQASGKVENPEISDSLGASEYGDQTIRVTLSCLFRGNELNISVNAAEDSYTTFNVEFDGDEGFKRFRSGTVAGTVLNIVKASREGETKRGMATLRDKSLGANGGKFGTRHSVSDVGSRFMNGGESGRVIHNGNVQASIVGDVLYAYATPIAIRKDGVVYAVDKKFSNTTTRLQDSLRGATKVSVDDFKVMLQAAGITDLGYLGEAGLFKPASPEQIDARRTPQERDVSNRRKADTWEKRILEGEPEDIDNYIGMWFEDWDAENIKQHDTEFYSFVKTVKEEFNLDITDLWKKYIHVLSDNRNEEAFCGEAAERLAKAGYYVYNSDTRFEVYLPEQMAEYDIEANESVNEAGLFKPATPEQIASRDGSVKQYTSINDAPLVGPPGSTEIWYYKSTDENRDQEIAITMGFDFCKKSKCLPDPNNLDKTHVLLGTTTLTGHGHIYNIMQGDEWSPEGEARNLIKSKGLEHTSMSVGDIVKEGNHIWLTDNVGFIDLSTGKRDEYGSASKEFNSTRDPREIAEAGLFKPATPEQVSNRPGYNDKVYAIWYGDYLDGTVHDKEAALSFTKQAANVEVWEFPESHSAFHSKHDKDAVRIFPPMPVAEGRPLFKPATPEQVAARPKAEPYLITVTLDPKYGRLITVGGFNLSIGNNYTDNHFIRFLVTQHPDLINELHRTIADNDDTIKFIYRGSYGNHEDTFSVYDFFQMVKGVEGQLDALQNGVEDDNGMNEAGLFKPATPEQIASRPQPKPRYFEFTATYYMISIRSSVRGFTDDISGSIGGGNLDLYDVETEVAGRNAYEEEDETYTHFSTSGKFKVRAPGDYPHNAEYTIEELTDWVIETLAEAIESLGGHYPQNLDVHVVGVAESKVTEGKPLFKPATPEQVAARKPHYKGGYKFLEFIDDANPEDSHWALSGAGGHFHFVDERNSRIYFHKNEDPEFQISIDTDAVTEEYLELDQDLTKECQEDFGKYDTGGWGSWIEKWLVAKGWTVLDSGNTCNWDPSYYWGGIFEYTTFEDTDGREGAVMMKHLGGDYRGNYAYPKVYFGDWGEFISAQNPGDPQEEIGYIFGYDGDYQALVADIKKYRAQPKENEEAEMSSEEPAPTHQAMPGQMNWAMQGENPAETHYESKIGGK